MSDGRALAQADRGYYVLFDYLRIVLAVGVFCVHATPHGTLPMQVGNALVQVFFALSGFLIGGILLASTPDDVPRFYFNRCTRIWIPYGIAIALLLAVTAVRQSLRDPKLWEFFFYKATFVYNVFGPPALAKYGDRMPLSGAGHHFWSICVEEQFYLVAPFVILFARRLRIAALVALVAYVFLFCATPDAASIALGVLLAVSHRRFGAWYLRPTGAAVCAGVVVAAAGVILKTGWEGGLYRIVVGPASAALVALVARRGHARPLGKTLGGMSYPFYLNHWLGLFVRHPLERALHVGAFATTIAALALALAIAFAHYRFVDLPVHERRGAWFTRRRGVAACATALALVVVGLSVGFALNRGLSS